MPADPAPTSPAPAPAAPPSLLALMFAAVEQASEAVVITTADLTSPGPTMLYVNPAFTRLTGYTAAEAVGWSPRLMQGPKTDAAMLARLRDHLAQGLSFVGRTVNYRKDGSEYTVDVRIAPVRDDRGTVTHFVAIEQDVSAEIRLEAELRRAQRLEAVGRLAGGVAHDFNNLLTVIGASVGFARAELPHDSRVHADLVDAEEAVRRAAALTRQLLAFSGRQRLQPRRVDANRAVSDVLGLLRRVLDEGVTVEARLAPDVRPVFVDPGQLEQVVVNLVLNARDAVRDASPDGGGRITISTANVVLAADAVARHSGLTAGEHVCLAVSDTGPGIAPDVLPHVFEPFFTTKGARGGTGLGLSTVYGIVQQSGGYVTADNARGGGAVFTVFLPRDAGPAAPAAPVEDRRAGRGERAARVLLVEDEAAVRHVLARMLRAEGYDVCAAADGEEAFDVWRDGARRGAPVDVVLTDLAMPVLGGRALAARIRAAAPAATILFMTGHADARAGTPREAEDGAAGEVLTKPVTADALRAAMARALDASPVAERATPRRGARRARSGGGGGGDGAADGVARRPRRA